MRLNDAQRAIIGCLGASLAATASPVRAFVGSVLVLIALFVPSE
jgi:hypothetical protein